MTDGLAEAVRAGDRRALARAITLVESKREDHRAEAVELIEAVLPATGGAARVGISGAPGVGKSTLIEALGLHLIDLGRQVAVLAVDPSSARTGGSILGDKTRMSDLGRSGAAFIRPSPAGETLGGVARRTREALLLCEAAGFDVVIVETVGVGQSEVAVAELVDLFVLVASPSGGDELQGIKRGIMELADLIAVNKADGPLLDAAAEAARELRSALRLMRPKDDGLPVEVVAVSATEPRGIDELWEAAVRWLATARAAGRLEALRAEQAVAWMWRELEESLLDRIRSRDGAGELLQRLEAAVRAGRTTPTAAVAEVLATLE